MPAHVHSVKTTTITRTHKGQEFSFIADVLGYSESWIKKRHLKALSKIGKML